jgi:hypothetical protein
MFISLMVQVADLPDGKSVAIILIANHARFHWAKALF